jgi:glycosyltransferase involved in cell wall biosynthesis
LRRTRSTIGAIEALGWQVLVASPHSEALPRDVPHIEIGLRLRQPRLHRLCGIISRNLMRFAITAATLLPRGRRLPLLARVGVLLFGLRGLMHVTHEEPPSVIVVHDVLLLPSVLEHRGDSRVIFDAREFFPQQFEHSFWWRAFIGSGMTRLLRQALPLCDGVTTVSPGIAEGYRRLTGIEPAVILNVPPRTSAVHRSGLRRSHAAPLRLVYHGLVNTNRGLSDLIESARALRESARLDLYLVGPKRLVRRLRRHAERTQNVDVRDAVPFDDILATLRSHDVGIAFFADRTFNLRYSLPSKFFEYLHAGLAVVVGPSPDMAVIVREYDCGVVTEDFEPRALTAALAGISHERLSEMRANASRAAEHLCADIEYDKMKDLLRHVVLSGDKEGSAP